MSEKDEIMRLADEYAKARLRLSGMDAARAALSAAVERACRENATLRGVLDRVRIRQEGEESALERAERDNAALREVERLRDEEIAGLREDHGNALIAIDALREVLKEWSDRFEPPPFIRAKINALLKEGE